MKALFISFCFTFFHCFCQGQNIIQTHNYKVEISDVGEILHYIDKNSSQDTISFCSDKFSGPSFENVTLIKIADNIFQGVSNGVEYKLEYKDTHGTFTMIATLKNLENRVFMPQKGVGLRLGLNTYMESFPQWNGIYFPTMLRSERTHFNSYFMTPNQDILTISSPDAIASWRYNYQQGTFGDEGARVAREADGVQAQHCLHRIHTVTLDLLHRLPLPSRHPQHLYKLDPHQEQKFTFHFNTTNKLREVNNLFHLSTKAPVLSAVNYTIAQGDSFQGEILADSLVRVEIFTPRSEAKNIVIENSNLLSQNSYSWSYTPISGAGQYKMIALSANGKSSEMILYVRPDFREYLSMARDEALEFKPTNVHHAECFYPLYTYFLARKHIPDAVKDQQAEEVYQDIFHVLYDDSLGEMRNGKFRIQDAATMVGVLTDRYYVTKNTEDLEKASKLADFLLKKQKDDGAYYSGHNSHYTSVIYIAKSIMELATAQSTLIADELWEQCYNRHKESALKAIKDLTLRADDIGTEGQHTFEDGMISCSVTQLAMAALKVNDKKLSEEFLSVARYLDRKHQCLTQKLIPDSRMNGGTLRFWEYQYTINLMHGGMNSPCGWSAWKSYGTWYLYLLTGEYHYMQQTLNTLGSALQLIDIETGEFHFGFITDPFVEAVQYKETPAGSGTPQMQRVIIGEQYLSKMSDWHVYPNETWRAKWGIDNFNHEIIKCMSEVFIENAYVIEHSIGSFETINCTAMVENGNLVIDYDKTQIKNIHINLSSTYQVVDKPQEKTYSHQTGFRWLDSIPNDISKFK